MQCQNRKDIRVLVFIFVFLFVKPMEICTMLLYTMSHCPELGVCLPLF